MNEGPPPHAVRGRAFFLEGGTKYYEGVSFLEGDTKYYEGGSL